MTGIGRQSKQQSFFKAQSLSHGGSQRRRRQGRGQRPLSCKEPLHCVFKIERSKLRGRSLRGPRAFPLAQKIIARYAQMFFVKVEQISIQGDHIHLLIRAPRRSQFHYFFRVVAGQIAQRFGKEGMLVTDTPGNRGYAQGRSAKQPKLWKFRPFSRIVRGYRTYKIVKDYIQLNEKEARSEIPYRKQRLRGLSTSDWAILWT